jgi:hypothetical protein
MAAAKRKHEDSASTPEAYPPWKRSPTNLPVKGNLLQTCYPYVKTLKEYLLSRLPSSSRLRRRKITKLGSGEGCSEIEARVAKVLDTTLVCTREKFDNVVSDTRWKQWLSFSQRADESYVTISDAREAASSLSEVSHASISLISNHILIHELGSRLCYLATLSKRQKVRPLPQTYPLRWLP